MGWYHGKIMVLGIVYIMVLDIECKKKTFSGELVREMVHEEIAKKVPELRRSRDAKKKVRIPDDPLVKAAQQAINKLVDKDIVERVRHAEEEVSKKLLDKMKSHIEETQTKLEKLQKDNSEKTKTKKDHPNKKRIPENTESFKCNDNWSEHICETLASDDNSCEKVPAITNCAKTCDTCDEAKEQTNNRNRHSEREEEIGKLEGSEVKINSLEKSGAVSLQEIEEKLHDKAIDLSTVSQENTFEKVKEKAMSKGKRGKKSKRYKKKNKSKTAKMKRKAKELKMDLKSACHNDCKGTCLPSCAAVPNCCTNDGLMKLAAQLTDTEEIGSNEREHLLPPASSVPPPATLAARPFTIPATKSKEKRLRVLKCHSPCPQECALDGCTPDCCTGSTTEREAETGRPMSSVTTVANPEAALQCPAGCSPRCAPKCSFECCKSSLDPNILQQMQQVNEPETQPQMFVQCTENCTPSLCDATCAPECCVQAKKSDIPHVSKSYLLRHANTETKGQD